MFRSLAVLAAAGATAVVIAIVGFTLLKAVPAPPAANDPRSTFVGVWISTSDADGGTQTMSVQSSDSNDVAVVVTDTIASVCSGSSSTMTGEGAVDGNRLVIPMPDYRCDDGSTPRALSGPPLDQQLHNLTYTRDPGTDTLTSNAGVWTRKPAMPASPSAQSAAPVAHPSQAVASISARATQLLNDFLAARIAGVSAEQYLAADPGESPTIPPLLYATTAGDPYDRAEFEPVTGFDWPYGLAGYRLRLYAGQTTVEQLVFADSETPLAIEYNPDGFATDIAPTSENGRAVPDIHSYADGEMTWQIGHPWVQRGDAQADYAMLGRLIPSGSVEPTTDGGERTTWDRLMFMADPTFVATGCQSSSAASDVQALAAALQSDPGLQVTAPVTLTMAGATGIAMDVKIGAGARICANVKESGDFTDHPGVLTPLFDGGGEVTMVGPALALGDPTGNWMRLYLFDGPDGLSAHTVVLAVVAPESSFDSATRAALDVVNSIGFHAP